MAARLYLPQPRPAQPSPAAQRGPSSSPPAMKVLRRSLHKDKDRISSSSSPTAPDYGQRPPSAILKQSLKHPPTQPFASLAANAGSPSNARSIGKPPTLVIRAITPYKSSRIVELSFQRGDFFHVVGERDDHLGSWFEASNPASGARGIVPKHCFELFGRKQPEPAAVLPQPPPASSNTPHTHAVPTSSLPPRSSAPRLHSSSVSSASPLLIRTPMSAEPIKSKSQPLYGIVQHDFLAERPDELDAKRGEPIIVIAQSNHEWFVAKPIRRLGGPGLIPVSFVEVQDVTTGKPLAPNQVQQLIQSSVVPKVEEWKKATAAYKGSSIPLGKFEFGSTPISSNSTASPLPHPSAISSSHGAHHHPSTRSASISNTSRQPSNAYEHPASSSRTHPHGSWHGARPADLPTDLSHSRQSSSSNTPWNSHHTHSHSGSQPSFSHAHYPQDDLPIDSSSGADGDGYATVDELRERYGVVVLASVESFHFEQDHYWFHLRAHFSRTIDDHGHQETTVLVLYRLYEDFYDFQAALLEMFPDEAGAGSLSDSQTILPRLPGPTENVDELVCAQRLEDLSIYLNELCELPLYIRESELVYEFLGPREGDVELEGDPGNLALDVRSPLEVEGEVVEYLQRMDSGHGDDQLDDLNQSIARLSTGSNGLPESHRHLPSEHQRQSSQASQASDSFSSRKSSNHHHHHPPHHFQRSHDPRTFSSSTTSTQKSSSEGIPSTLPSTHNSASSSIQNGSRVRSMTHSGALPDRESSDPPRNPVLLPPSGGSHLGPGGFLRIKIYQRQTDDLIAIRAPNGVGYSELLNRIRDRVGPEVQSIRFRDESGTAYSTGGSSPILANHGARFVGIDNDDDLDRWIGSGCRLILYVD